MNPGEDLKWVIVIECLTLAGDVVDLYTIHDPDGAVIAGIFGCNTVDEIDDDLPLEPVTIRRIAEVYAVNIDEEKIAGDYQWFVNVVGRFRISEQDDESSDQSTEWKPVLLLEYYSRSTRIRIGYYAIPEDQHEAVMKMLGLKTIYEFLGGIAIKLKTVRLLAKSCVPTVENEVISNDYMWFIDLYGDYGLD